MKTISILSNIANIAILSVLLLASDNNSSEGSLDHVNIVKPCINGITLLGHISGELEKKGKIICEILLTQILHCVLDQNQGQLPQK